MTTREWCGLERALSVLSGAVTVAPGRPAAFSREGAFGEVLGALVWDRRDLLAAALEGRLHGGSANHTARRRLLGMTGEDRLADFVGFFYEFLANPPMVKDREASRRSGRIRLQELVDWTRAGGEDDGEAVASFNRLFKTWASIAATEYLSQVGRGNVEGPGVDYVPLEKSRTTGPPDRDYGQDCGDHDEDGAVDCGEEGELWGGLAICGGEIDEEDDRRFRPLPIEELDKVHELLLERLADPSQSKDTAAFLLRHWNSACCFPRSGELERPLVALCRQLSGLSGKEIRNRLEGFLCRSLARQDLRRRRVAGDFPKMDYPELMEMLGMGPEQKNGLYVRVCRFQGRLKQTTDAWLLEETETRKRRATP